MTTLITAAKETRGRPVLLPLDAEVSCLTDSGGTRTGLSLGLEGSLEFYEEGHHTEP